jgi:hypothetical protein
VCDIFDNPPILIIKFGAGAIRDGVTNCIIIFAEPEPEPQLDAAPAPSALAPKLMFNVGGLSKMSHTVAVSVS